MATVRRPRIKASTIHLASLAGKRRVGSLKPTIETTKNDAIIPEVEAEVVTEVVTPAPPAAASTAAEDQEKPRLKARFRPNLSESDQQRGRLRRISGCESNPGTPGGGRVRTISGTNCH